MHTSSVGVVVRRVSVVRISIPGCGDDSMRTIFAPSAGVAQVLASYGVRLHDERYLCIILTRACVFSAAQFA